MDTPDGGGLSPEERSLVPAGSGGGYLPPPPPAEEEDSDDEGMLRMSFLEHLEEMRSRIIRALMGFGVAFHLVEKFCEVGEDLRRIRIDLFVVYTLNSKCLQEHTFCLLVCVSLRQNDTECFNGQ